MPDTASTSSQRDVPFAASTEATQQFLDQGQLVVKWLMDLNGELRRFLADRMGQNSEAVHRMMKCRTMPDMLNIGAEWMQKAFADYSDEANRLLQLNTALFGCMVPGTNPPESSH